MNADAASILSLAIRLVSAKAIILIALLVTSGLFAWAMWMREWIALAIAGAFAVIVFLPVLFQSVRGDHHAEND